MEAVLISGPAGAGKSQVAQQMLDENPGAVIADFQSVYVALTGVTRGIDGTFPLRIRSLLPLTQRIKQTIISDALEDQVRLLLVTNSDRDEKVRKRILSHMYAKRIPQDSDLVYLVNESRTRPMEAVLGEVYPGIKRSSPFDVSEIVLDPGEDEVSKRLVRGDNDLSTACQQALARWYQRQGSNSSYMPRRRRR